MGKEWWNNGEKKKLVHIWFFGVLFCDVLFFMWWLDFGQTMSLVQVKTWEASYLGGHHGALVYTLVVIIRNKLEHCCWGVFFKLVFWLCEFPKSVF